MASPSRFLDLGLPAGKVLDLILEYGYLYPLRLIRSDHLLRFGTRRDKMLLMEAKHAY